MLDVQIDAGLHFFFARQYFTAEVIL